MTYYDPQAPPQPQQQQVSLGPYNAEQAPHMECESCGSPITVGQELVELRLWRLAIMLPSGQLCFWPTEESKMVADQQQAVYVHADCSAEYAHDHITKEPCGNEDGYEGDSDGVNECEFCGVEIADGYRACSGCGSKLGIPG